MRKTILTIVILFSIFSVVLTSCKKDDDDDPQDIIELNGTYKLVMDANTVAEGTSTEVGMLNNNVSMGKNQDFGIIISNVPESVGGIVVLGDGDTESIISITGMNILGNGTNEMYFSLSGTVTRTSTSRITFEGTCRENASLLEHTFSGYVEADAFKII